MTNKKQFLRFEECGVGKTRKFVVSSTHTGDILGRIAWHGAWRQYVFEPTTQFPTIWSCGCAMQLGEFIQSLNLWQKKGTKVPEAEALRTPPIPKGTGIRAGDLL